MQDLRDQVISDLIGKGGSESGFFQAVERGYARLHIGSTLDFTALQAWWQGAALSPEWRRELAAAASFEPGADAWNWKGIRVLEAVQGWMLSPQPLARWPLIDERCSLLLAPLLPFGELARFFLPRLREQVPGLDVKAWRQLQTEQLMSSARALRDGDGDWAGLAAVYRAAGVEPGALAQTLADFSEKRGSVTDMPDVLLRLQLGLVLLREQALIHERLDPEWAFALLRELADSYALRAPYHLQDEWRELLAQLLLPVTRAAAESAGLRDLCGSEKGGGVLFCDTGLLDAFAEPPARWQALLASCSAQTLRDIPVAEDFARRRPLQTLQFEQAVWQRCQRFGGGSVTTPEALAWYGRVLADVSDDRTFSDGLDHLAQHVDAAQLRELIDSLVLGRGRDLPWRVADCISDRDDLVRYIGSSGGNVAAQAASRLRELALDDETGTRRGPWWPALLALSERHADLLIEVTVDGDSAASDSMERWEALWRAARSDEARQRLVKQCLRAVARPASRDAVLALTERLYAQQPELFHTLIAEGAADAPRFNASLADCATPLRALVARVSAAYLSQPGWFSGPPTRLNAAAVSSALAAYPGSYAALEDRQRVKLLALLDASAVAACASTLAEMMTDAGKPARAELIALLARTPLAVLRSCGLPDVSARKARLLLLTGLAQNKDADAPAWIAAHIHDKSHDDYSRGLSLDRLARNGHSLAGLDDWAGATLEGAQTLAAQQKTTAAAAKAWAGETATVLAPLGETLGRYLLQVLIDAGDSLPRRARQILELLPPARRTDFAASGVKTWIVEKGADKFNWLLLPLSVYGDERVANDLVRAAKAWMKTRKQKASAVMHQLCRIPGIYGVAQVRELWESRKFSDSIQRNAKEALTEAAEREGLGLAEYLEQLVPDFGFSHEGLKLDLGPHAYWARLHSDFSLRIVDADGKPSKTLPRARPGEDSDLRGVAQNQLKMLAKNLKPLLKQQTARLLRALQTGKSWSAAQWRSLFQEHPLLAVISQGVVWSALDAQGESLARFRPSGSGELVDASDTPYLLDPSLRVGVAHPQQISAAELGAWQSQFADYELISPFGQFEIPVFVATDAELAEHSVARADGTVLNRARFGSLVEKWGYIKGAGEDGAMINEHRWQADADWRITLSHSGISVFFEVDEEVTVEGLQPRRRGPEGYEPVTLAELPPALRATLLAQAEALKALAL